MFFFLFLFFSLPPQSLTMFDLLASQSFAFFNSSLAAFSAPYFKIMKYSEFFLFSRRLPFSLCFYILKPFLLYFFLQRNCFGKIFRKTYLSFYRVFYSFPSSSSHHPEPIFALCHHPYNSTKCANLLVKCLTRPNIVYIFFVSVY